MPTPETRYQHRNAPSDARAVACEVVAAWLRRDDRTMSMMHQAERTAGEAGLDRRDQALACELVMGVVRHRLTLSKVLGAFTSQGWAQVRRELQPVLLVGAYQILWLESVPDFAAVDVAVSQAKAVAGTGGGRFANAVLRHLIRAIETYRAPLSEADPRRTIPLGDGQGCVFDRDLFTDPQHDLANWLSETTSHPCALVTRWIHAHGQENARQVCMAGLARPPLALRPNVMKTTPAELQKLLKKESAEASVGDDGMVTLHESVRLMELASFREGLFQPQDPTAARVVREMNVRPGQTVLDLCAGVGTKSTQIAEAMRDQGHVIACDKDAAKLNALRTNAERLSLRGIRCVTPETLDSEMAALERLDWILIDVPCSNTGVLGRRPEARYRLNHKLIVSLTGLQRDLCETAFRLARRDTRIAYSTCSIEPEENAALMQRMGRDHPDWRLERSEQILPQASEPSVPGHDGGYRAIWKRI